MLGKAEDALEEIALGTTDGSSWKLGLRHESSWEDSKAVSEDTLRKVHIATLPTTIKVAPEPPEYAMVASGPPGYPSGCP